MSFGFVATPIGGTAEARITTPLAIGCRVAFFASAAETNVSQCGASLAPLAKPRQRA